MAVTSTPLEVYVRIAEPARAGRLVVALDYDGTLVPMAPRPEQAECDDATRHLLRRVARRHPVVVMSGRALADVRRLVDVGGLVYGGCHGLEIEGPGGLAFEHGEARLLVPVFERTAREIDAALADVEGMQIEPKPLGLAVHFRLVPEALQAHVERTVRAIVARHEGLSAMAGSKLVNVVPDVPWDKGRALSWLLPRLGPASWFPLYLGDDVTDEDGFAAVAQTGLGVLVAPEPRPTAASVRLAGPEDVHRLLELIADVVVARQLWWSVHLGAARG